MIESNGETESRYMRKLIKSVVVWLFALLAAATIVVVVVSVASLRLTFYQMYDAKTKDTLPDYKAGEKLPFGWKYTGRELSRDHVWKYGFAAADGAEMEVFFQPAAPSIPCFARTQLSNVLYKSPRRLTTAEESGLLRIVEAVKQNERTLKYGPLKTLTLVLRSLPDMMIAVIIYLLLVLLIYDVSNFFNAAGEGVSTGCKTAGQPPGRGRWLYAALGCAFATILLIGAFKNSYWAYFTCDEYFFLPRSAARGMYMAYVTGDPGMPAIPYRAVLPLLISTGNLLVLRGFPVVFLVVAMWAVYCISIWSVRPQIAWLVPVAMLCCGSFTFAIADVRGYSVFICFGVLSLLMYGLSVGKPQRTTLFLWTVVSALAVMSNPVIVALIAAMLFHYFFFLRKQLNPQDRRIFDTHSFFIILIVLFFSTVILHATMWHSAERRETVAPFFSGLTPVMLLCAVPLTAGAFYFRKDFRGAVALSAFAGIAAAAALLAFNVLDRLDRYYLFVLPFVFIYVGYLAEEALLKIERRGGFKLGRVAAVASVVIISALLIVRGDFKRLYGDSANDRMKKGIYAVAKILDENNKNNLPVVVYPLDHFFFFIEQKYALNPLGGESGRDNFDTRRNRMFQKNNNVLFQYNNYFAISKLKDAGVESGPVYVVLPAEDSGRRYVIDEARSWYRASAGRCSKLTSSEVPAVYYCKSVDKSSF